MSTDYEVSGPPELTTAELIRAELRGKFLAIERYDSMLWKIRSGYVVVLYGALTILGGTSGLIAIPNAARNRMLFAGMLLVCGFSLCGLVVDFFFLRAKFRVINDTNELQDLALGVATGNRTIETEYHRLRELLHISGERAGKVQWAQLFYDAWASVIWIYLASPLLAIAVLFVLRGS
jgi:hypothetical protein